jgi:hypothetical protein
VCGCGAGGGLYCGGGTSGMSSSVTRQSQLVGSLHPLKTVSPWLINSHQVGWKNTLQPASHSAATERRLFVSPGSWCASRACGGSHGRSRSNTLVV